MNTEILMLREVVRIPDASGIRVNHASFSAACPIHWHDYYTFDIVLSGNGIQTVNGTASLLSPGDIDIVHPSDIHSIRPAREGETVLLLSTLFSARAVPECCRAVLYGPCEIFHPDPETIAKLTSYAKEIDRWNSRAVSVSGENDSGGTQTDEEIQAFIRLYFELILRLVLSCARSAPRVGDKMYPADGGDGTDSDGDGDSGAIRRAIRYLDGHFLENPSVAEVSRKVGFSSAYFSTRFRRSVGCTYSEYLMHRRLSYACSLLAAGKSVSDACYESGFGSLSYFGAMFLRHIGVTPGKYRN